MRALASSAWSTASEFSTFGISLSQKQWLGHKAVLDSDPGQWPRHHCGQWQHWQQCLSQRTRAVLSSARALHASACHSGAVLCEQCSSTACQCLSLLSAAPVLWPQWCGPMRQCSATGIKFTNADLKMPILACRQRWRFVPTFIEEWRCGEFNFLACWRVKEDWRFEDSKEY